ncbi:Adenosylhomocysteinase [Actinacidiphila bryophytorum]|uniref:Adenosylhomocysteinase n=1 Tax=Actinacidiphila bryophytorum TaxID=1436133 RepID=A0A9W4H1X3_9ACTN|nr:Adenosylhomocysteinase [Actinacidiphila bryophytorum]
MQARLEPLFPSSPHRRHARHPKTRRPSHDRHTYPQPRPRRHHAVRGLRPERLRHPRRHPRCQGRPRHPAGRHRQGVEGHRPHPGRLRQQHPHRRAGQDRHVEERRHGPAERLQPRHDQ